MATRKNIEFKVGVTILFGIIILAGSLYWLQGYRLAQTSQRIYVLFEDVGTLAVGDKVTVSGVRRGKVDGLELTRDGVVVQIVVRQDVALRSDATFTIKNLGVMGERFIAIDPGKADSALTADTVRGRYDIGIPEVMGKLGEMITELRTLVITLKGTIASDTSLDKLSSTLNNLESLTGSMASYMKRNEQKLDKTAENFLQASNRLNDLLTTNTDRIDSTMTSFARTSQRLEDFVISLDSVAATARRFATALETEDGTLQLMMEDRRLYDDLREAADNLDDLIQDIRDNPQKYIDLKVEIF